MKRPAYNPTVDQNVIREDHVKYAEFLRDLRDRVAITHAHPAARAFDEFCQQLTLAEWRLLNNRLPL